MNNNYILQLEAKDIVNGGYVIKKNNKKKYKATLDYSLDAINLDYFFPKKKIFYDFEGKQYSDVVMSIKFKYSLDNNEELLKNAEYINLLEKLETSLNEKKENKYNNTNKVINNKLKKLKSNEKNYEDTIEKLDNKLTTESDVNKLKAIKSKRTRYINNHNIYDKTLKELQDQLENINIKINNEKLSIDEINTQINIIKNKYILSTAYLRDKLYENGFDITMGERVVHMVRFKRSGGSSRVGKCLFIREDLYKKMMDWSYMELNHDDGVDIDLASIEAYISLTTSSIIDTIQIPEPSKSILIIEDAESTFDNIVMATENIHKVDKNGKYILDKEGNHIDKLITSKKNISITNKIWDGQSLADSSLFGIAPNENVQWVDGKYKDKGFLLLRNRFFKSACFNTNIKQYMKDRFGDEYETATVKDMFGNELKVKDILIITTPSSVKYLKYGEWKDYIRQLESTFGIVKYDKPTHFYNGNLVSTHYQLLNTIQLDKDAMKQFLQPTLDYIKLLKTDIRVFRNHLHIKQKENLENLEINSTDDFMFNMLMLNDKFQYTDTFIDFKKDTISSYVSNIKQGHVLIEGNYSVLFGNCLEMLKASTGDFKGYSVLNGDEIHCKNFDYNLELLGCRSPHVTIGNLWLCKNVQCNAIDKYFNLSKQIICVNSIGNNVLERLSSSDFDSDQLLLTPCNQLISSVKKNYDKFLVPTSKVEAEKVKRTNTWKEKSDLDVKTSINKIGEIINLSQFLNSKLWDMINDKGFEIDSKEVQDLYADISQLDIMSCIEIDKSKKEFSVNNVSELSILRKKYKDLVLTKVNIKKVKKKKKNWNDEDEFEDKKVLEVVEDNNILELWEKSKKYKSKEYKKFIIDNDLSDYKESAIRPYFMQYVMEEKYIDNYIFRPLHTSIDYLEQIIEEEIKKIRGNKRNTKTITTFTAMFSEGITLKHARTEQITKIINEIKELKKETSKIWADKNLEKGDKYIKANVLKNEYIKKVEAYKINSDTIKKIIKQLDEEQTILRQEKNKDKKIKKCEITGIGRKLLSILFKSHTAEFLKIFEEQKENIETIRSVRKNEDIKDEEIIEIYGMNYMVDKK